MIRTAFLLLALIANRHHYWDIGRLKTGEWHVWAGTLLKWDQGAHAYLEWDDEGFAWCPLWIDLQDPDDEFEPWGWCAKGRIGGETRITTPIVRHHEGPLASCS